MKKSIIYLCLSALCIAGGLFYTMNSNASDETNIAILSVTNLSCGSCIENINNAFSEVNAVTNVEVDLGLAQALIEYDQQKISPEKISAIITEAGYPSTIRQTLSSDEYVNLLAENVIMSKTHVGKIGSRLITNEEFDVLVGREFGTVNESDQNKYTLARKSVWDRMVQREVILQEAAKSSIVIQPGEVDSEIKLLSEKFPKFDDLVVERYGSLSNFKIELREKLLIDQYLDNTIFAGLTDELERQQVFGSWYSTLRKNTNITVFDESLNAAVSAGCGGSCCG